MAATKLSAEYARYWGVADLGEAGGLPVLGVAGELPEEERAKIEGYLRSPVVLRRVSRQELLLAQAAELAAPAGSEAGENIVGEEIASPEAPAVVAAKGLLLAAASRGATDLHLHLSPEGLRTVLRLGGSLREHLRFPPGLGAAVIRRLLALADLDPFSPDPAQEGSLSVESEAGRHAARLSLLRRRRDRLSLALRLFPPANRRPGTEAILPEPRARGRLKKLAAMSQGLLLFCGPTGAGKSTTLHALFREEAEGGRRVVALEDPVEQEEERFLQLDMQRVEEPRRLLEAALRQDPDILLLGEVRNREAASYACEAALTGHLVATTLHATSVAGAIERFLDLGAPAGAVRESLRGVVYQRLVNIAGTADPRQRLLPLFEIADLRGIRFDGAALTGKWWRRFLERTGYLTLSEYRRRLVDLGYTVAGR